jgi:HlyD family secretion protein/adhesin transport system membrane fusion protein
MTRSAIKRSSPKDTLGKTLTLPLGLVNDRKVRFFRSLTYVCCALVIGITAWSAVAEFREVAVAPGQIVPLSTTQKVHHLEGGILETVFVAEGVQVEKGQPLVRLRPEGAGSDLDQLEAHLAGLRMQHIRLQALLTGEEPGFSGFDAAFDRIKREQAELYTRTRARDAEEREKLRLVLLQTKAEFEALSEERAGLIKQVEIEAEQVHIREQTFNQGHTSRIAFLEAQSRLSGVQAKLAAISSKYNQLGAKVQEASQGLERMEADRVQKLADERSKVIGEITEKENAKKKFEDRVARLVVRSPERGIVHLLAQRTPGEVIKPGDLVAEIVSHDTEMIAEVRLAVKDIGHVGPGAPATLKVSNYDPTGMEVVTGRVLDISATTFETKEGQLYYRTRIGLDQAYVGPRERGWRLLPGMVVEADIITGNKSLMRYMLKPVYRSLNTALGER